MSEFDYELSKEMQDAINAEGFLDRYGFEHICQCADDVIAGNVGLVPQCYCNMTDDALEACHRMKGELAERSRTEANLLVRIAELGGETGQ